ncbi:MAG: hypothetical protein KAT00_02180 [Planctomycetes bacterium]|nr:hypothetical protein [Planctomycetota bacterium]
MPDDINIHVKTPGADKAKTDLDQIGQSGKKLGDQVASGSKKAADATEKSTKKLSGMGRILGALKSQVLGLAGAWLGMQGVTKLVAALNEKLQRTSRLQQEIYNNSLQLAEVGQSLEIQTGTIGHQQDWTQKAAELQKAGGLQSPGVAKDMMISMDIAQAEQGGIKNPQVMDLARELAPFVGANQMTGDEVSKLFEFAGTAKVDPTAVAYKEYFAKLQAGYTSSKATSFGQFMTGLQKGGTPYIAQGGSPEEAISAFAAARAVTDSEPVAATLLAQVARFSSGAYEKPRTAVEQSQGVQWDQLKMDQRMAVLLKHIASLPESRRTQEMIEQGFEPGLATEVQKMVTPEALMTMRSTRREVGAATPSQIDQQMQAFLGSNLGIDQQIKAESAALEAEAGPGFAAWQQRLERATAKHRILAAKGEDRFSVKDAYEPQVIAIEEILQEVKALTERIPKGTDESREAYDMLADIYGTLGRTSSFYSVYSASRAKTKGYEYEQRLREVLESTGQNEQQATQQTTNIHHHNETIYQPRIGSDNRGPRIGSEVAN